MTFESHWSYNKCANHQRRAFKRAIRAEIDRQPGAEPQVREPASHKPDTAEGRKEGSGLSFSSV